MENKRGTNPFRAIAIICGLAGGVALATQLFDSLGKVPGELRTKQQQQELSNQAQLQKQQQQLQAQQQQAETAQKQQQLQADIQLQQLERSRPVDTPRVSTNAVTACDGGYQAVNLRRAPGGDIAYAVGCGSPIYATGQRVLAGGTEWELVYFGGLAGWMTTNGIHRGEGL